MSKTTVFQYKVYNAANDEMRLSRRWGTREGIEAVHGTAIEGTATEVDESVVGTEVFGLTAIGFNPRPRTGFQTQVTAYSPLPDDRPIDPVTGYPSIKTL